MEHRLATEHEPVRLSHLIAEDQLMWVYCRDCGHERDVTPVTVPLPSDTPVPEIGKHMECSLCGLYPGALKLCGAVARYVGLNESKLRGPMSLATIMLDQLAIARRIVEDGQQLVPAWRIMTPEGTFIILSPFNAAKPEKRDQAIYLIGRFMAWKMATSFVFTDELWRGAEGRDALRIVGVSRYERLAVLQRMVRGDNLNFSEPMWLPPHNVEDRFATVLPQRLMEMTGDEIVLLERVFGKNGELPAQRVA
jgi:hypothetical protein